MSAVLVYMTAANRSEAEQVGKALIESRLAACVNILDSMQAMFWWGGQVEKDSETVLLAKTRVGLVGRLNAKVAEVHSYETPCVVAVPIIDGNPEFLQWIHDETADG